MAKIDWEKIINYYTSIKELYIECEETDPELKTNLQPLNEFRAALDHLMRISAIEHLDVSDYPEINEEEEARKLSSHLKRAYYDVCDMLSMNYRNKIIDMLQSYSSETISKAIPNYYSDIRPKIEKLSGQIAQLRDEKGFSKIPAEDRMKSYKSIVDELKGYYIDIRDAAVSLEDIHKEKLSDIKHNRLIQIGIPVVALIVGAVIGLCGWLIPRPNCNGSEAVTCLVQEI